MRVQVWWRWYEAFRHCCPFLLDFKVPLLWHINILLTYWGQDLTFWEMRNRTTATAERRVFNCIQVNLHLTNGKDDVRQNRLGSKSRMIATIWDDVKPASRRLQRPWRMARGGQERRWPAGRPTAKVNWRTNILRSKKINRKTTILVLFN